MRFIFSTCLLIASLSAQAASVDSLSWMEGRWSGNLGPATLEETWNDPKAGTMVALVRMTTPDGVGFVELIVINEEDDTLVLRLQQFSATYEPLMPSPQRLVMSGQTDTSISFSAEDGPMTALTYSRDGNTFTIQGVSAQGPFEAKLEAIE